MNRVGLAVVGALALAALAGPVGAADLSPRYGPPITKAPMYAPGFNWTGFYVGINGGGAWGTSRWDSTNRFDVNGWLIGGTAGYNWQLGQAVFGIEADIDATNINGSTTAFCNLGCRTKNNWLGTVRGRLGYAFDRFLPYVTGGAAFGDIQASTPGFAGNSTTNVGYALGGGIEFAVLQNLSVKAEYLFVDLGDFNCGLACGARTNDKVSFRSNIFRGGLNYRF